MSTESIALAVLFGSFLVLLTFAGIRVHRRQADPAGPLPPRKPDAASRRLLRAGLWRPGALESLYAAKALCGLLLPLGGAFVLRVFLAQRDLRLVACAALAVSGFALPDAVLLFASLRRKRRILRGLPNCLDLLVMCLDSGLALDGAVVEAARGLEHAHSDLAQELALLSLELREGGDRTDAFRNLGLRTGIRQLRDLSLILIQADRAGTGVAESLRAHAAQLRAMAGLDAEERIGRLPVKLTLPIFLCTMPSALILLFGPTAVRFWRETLPLLEPLLRRH